MQILSLASVGPRTGLCSLGSLLFFCTLRLVRSGATLCRAFAPLRPSVMAVNELPVFLREDGTRLSRSVCFHDIFAQGVNVHGLAFHLPK